MLVVHEDNHTGGFGAEVLATVGEQATRPVRFRRVTRADTPVPYHFGNQLEVLPSYPRILQSAADFLGCDRVRPRTVRLGDRSAKRVADRRVSRLMKREDSGRVEGA